MLSTNGVASTPTTNDGESVPRSPLPTAAAAVSDVTNSAGFEFIDGVDDEADGDDGSCSCSCDEDDAGDARTSPETAEPVGAAAVGCSVETQTDPESLNSSMTSLLDPASGDDKMTRLCNINELLRQIDEQFNSVLRGATTSLTLPPDVAETPGGAPLDLSPTNSDEPRGGSETEADRACPPRFFPGVARSDNTEPGETTAPDRRRVTKPADSPVIRPVPLVPRGPSPGSVVGETVAGAGRGSAPLLVPYRGATTTASDLASAVSADRLSSRPTQPGGGTSSSPATVASEGYHSDRVPPAEPSPDFPVIIREIPKRSTSATPPVRFPGDLNMRPQSKRLNSPDDVDV